MLFFGFVLMLGGCSCSLVAPGGIDKLIYICNWKLDGGLWRGKYLLLALWNLISCFKTFQHYVSASNGACDRK